MMYRYKLLCLLLILGFNAKINCMYRDGDGNHTPSWWLISTTLTSGITMAYFIGKDIFARFSANRPLKNSTTQPTTLTLAQVEFQKVQYFFDQRMLDGVKHHDHKEDDYNEFIDRVDQMNKKDYNIELSKVLLDCANQKTPESSDYQRYSRCLEHANQLASDKKTPQEKETVKTGEEDQQN